MTQRPDPALALRRQPIDWRFKGFPVMARPVAVSELGAQGWNILDGDLYMPVLVLKRSAYDHNLRVMREYCQRSGVDLAPHAKTCMAPRLLTEHVAAGAWGFTVASASQARVLREFGLRRLIVANQIVEPAVLQWLSRELDEDPGFDLLSLVDSREGVSIIAGALRAVRARRPMRVLVELGRTGGRAGCRTIAEAVEVARAVREADGLELAGVEGFEGLIDAGSVDATVAAVDDFLTEMRELVLHLDDLGAFTDLPEVIVSAGGSAFFDRVVQHLTGWSLTRPIRTILRSGCYAAHDDGMYEEISPLAGRGSNTPSLRHALELWGAVLSRPEPGLAVVGMGKRDVAYDYRLPTATTVRSADGRLRSADKIAVTGLNDQHARLAVAPDDPLAPGDRVTFGMSHPCAAFDKWRLIPVVDDGYNVIDAIHTFF